MRYLRLLTAVAGLAVLAGCATTSEDQRTSAWMEMEQARQARLDVVASQCQTDLCLVMVAQEQGRSAIRPPQKTYHPAWNILDRALGVAIPAYFGARQVRDLAGVVTDTAGIVASIDRADNSVNVGGNYGDTDNSTNVGGNFGDTNNSTNVGADLIGGDNRVGHDVGGDQIGGDDIDGSCVGDACRNTSPGPIDQSDNSNNSDNSTQNREPSPEPEP